MDTIVKTVPLSSLHKMFPNISPEEKAMSSFAGMKNEPISFQVAYKTMPGNGMNTAFYIKVISDLPITIYEEGSLLLHFPGVRQHYSFKKEDATHLMWAHFSGVCVHIQVI